MGDINQFKYLDQVTGGSDKYAWDYVEYLIDRGLDGGASMLSEGNAGFNLNTGLGSWLPAMSGGGRKNIVVMGDSNVQHEPANTYRWAQALKADLLTLTGLADGGEGFRQTDLVEYSRTGTWTRIGSDPILAGTQTDIGPHGAAWTVVGNANVMTWTLPGVFATHDRFVLYGVDDDFISIQGEYSLNGGAFTATAWDYGPASGTRLVKQEIVGAVTTTLRVRGANVLFPNYYVGHAFYNGTAGLIVNNIGQGGNAVDVMAGGSNAKRLALLDDLQPKLTIIWTGTNEFHHDPTVGIFQDSLDYWYTNYKKIVTKARQYGDVLMIYPQSTQLPNVFSPAEVPIAQMKYDRRARALAHEMDCAYISVPAMWGDWNRHNARAWAADAWHINQAGHEAVKKVITRMIQRNS